MRPICYIKKLNLQGFAPEVLSLGKVKIKCKSEDSMNEL